MAARKEDLFAALAGSGLPFANETWWPDPPPPLPYLVAAVEGVSTWLADDEVAMRCTRYRIELYSHGRDYASEAAVEAALAEHGVAWSARPVGVVDQTDVYEIQYSAEVLGD